jgi:hypothetical protein
LRSRIRQLQGNILAAERLQARHQPGGIHGFPACSSRPSAL